MTDREKLIKLLCEANSKSVDAELFEDSSYAQQLEMEADFLIANGVTFAKDTNVLTKAVEAQRKKIAELEKSNRNWRRKAQRLRKRNAKEVE